MNTPAHLIFGAALFGKRDAHAITTAALIGSLLPDASLYFMVFWNGIVLGIDEQVIFGTLYFNDFWQSVFAIDNSIPLWGALLLVALVCKLRVGVVLCGSALLHIVLDLLLHHDDGRQHFWPLSDWIFESPISYWDPRAFGNIVGPVEVAICLVFLIVLWRRFRSVWSRCGIIFLGIAEFVPFILFAVMFGSP